MGNFDAARQGQVPQGGQPASHVPDMQESTAQFSTALHSTARHGTTQHGGEYKSVLLNSQSDSPIYTTTTTIII